MSTIIATRRVVLSAGFGLTVALAALTASGATSPAAAREKLVINSYGGAYEQIHRKLVIEPFSKKYDVDVQVITAYSADALAQLRAQKAAPQFDVIHFSGGQEVVAAREGLIAPIKLNELSNGKDLYPFAVEGLSRGEGPVHAVAAIGLLYNKEKAKKPEKWADLWNAQYKDHVVLTDLSNSYGLLGFLMMNKVKGGDITNADPGFNAVKTLLDSAVVVATSPEMQQNFAQNDAWIAPYAQDYAYTLRKAGLPIEFVQGAEGTPAVYLTANLVANRPNQDLAKKFIDFSLSPEVQAGWAQELRYSPTNKATKLDETVAKEVIYGPDAVAGLIRFDPVAVDANRAALVERWKKLIAK
ncbi:ABC transporter substrate-binding protein [Chelatococcus asaccharovorans]|uniref:Putative spermidine/putrescine transport system substrate-binding protein n=1 Tax=Chelatococcus asaccharovorans TaxID=28210 RepID=A0A2V3U3K4_9HYPH|nr:ABC transporter substrate-binding protein [Chelatococcus asaccharovorans]MBS7702182.1 ABC transporter substrate-binding protein [Chelatococcus asaccharovorans]PXW56620.1 putative spermidine/putrescine transport system substrate-binding protein [Chelatococcus asaccharovorans]